MRLLPLPPRTSIFSVAKGELHYGPLPNAPQGVLKHNLSSDQFLSKLLDRKWALSCPDAKIHQITVLDRPGSGLNGKYSFQNNRQPCLGEEMMAKKKSFGSFYVVRDDLLHPMVNGNKARKLDALLPLLEDNLVSDVVTCGGCQSAHAAAVAVSCAERALNSHLLLRGEQPEILTGYNLISSLYGNVTYVPRTQYARRQEMLARHAESVAGSCGSIEVLNDYLEASFKDYPCGNQIMCSDKARKVVIVNEGAGDAVALLGLIRLVKYLCQNHLFGTKKQMKIVLDAGTGTSAIGLGIGALCLELPWKIMAVMLADKMDGYRETEENLISEFLKICPSPLHDVILSKMKDGIVQWVDRSFPRKFGNILEGEVEECKRIAKQTGILVDPVYTLAAWDLATQISQDTSQDSTAVMLHTGGTLGMFGLAQRYRSYFQKLKGGVPNEL